jgi:hypothetical protein
MTRNIKVLGLALIAMLALGVVGAGSASALLFLVKGGAASESFTVKNLNNSAKPATLETAGKNTITCNSVLGKGTILNKTDMIEKILFTAHECTDSLGSSCQTAGEPSGLVTSLDLRGLLITTLNDKYGIVLSAEKANHGEGTCGSGLFEVKIAVSGTIAGEFTETLAESQTEKTVAQIEFKKGANAGEPAIKDYWTLEGIRTSKLETTVTGAINETAESNESALGDVVTVNGVTLCHN